MKYLLPLCSILFFTSVLVAQVTITLTPNPVPGTTLDSVYWEAEAVIQNQSATADTFVWERTIIQIEPDSLCLTAVADINAHYPPHVSTRTFVLDAGQSGPLDVFMFGMLNEPPCCGIVHLDVTDVNNPQNTLTGVYLFGECTTGTGAPANPPVTAFPNPADEFLQLQHAENVRAVRFYTLDGRLVSRMDRTGGPIYPLGALTAGTYLAVLEDENGRFFQAIEVIKR